MWVQILTLLLTPVSYYCTFWEAAGSGLSSWMSAIQVGELDWVPSSGLGLEPTLTNGSIWRANHQTRFPQCLVLYLSHEHALLLSLPYNLKKYFTQKENQHSTTAEATTVGSCLLGWWAQKEETGIIHLGAWGMCLSQERCRSAMLVFLQTQVLKVDKTASCIELFPEATASACVKRRHCWKLVTGNGSQQKQTGSQQESASFQGLHLCTLP